MSDLDKFLAAAAALYNTAPGFFQWFIVTLAGTYLAMAAAGYWVGTKVEGAGKENLKNRIDALQERMHLAKDQAQAAEGRVESLNEELDELRTGLAQNVVTFPDGQRLNDAIGRLGYKVSNLVTANNAVVSTLERPTFSIGGNSVSVTSASNE